MPDFDTPVPKMIVPPVEGWEENTWYLVEVSYRSQNPIHRALFYSGFLNGQPEGTAPWPGSYSGIIPANYVSYDPPTPINRIHYLKAIRVLLTDEERRV